MAAAAAEEVWQNVKTFIEQNEGFIDDRLHSSINKTTGIRGLFASEPIDKESPIIKIPSACMIDGTPFLETVSSLALKHTTSDISLALSLLQEREKGDKSFYAPYLSTLPTEEDFVQILPSWWSESEQVNHLQGSPILGEIEKERTHLTNDYDLLFEAGIIENFTKNDLKWALGVVNSRAFDRSSSENKGEEVCLVPAMDMMNHARPCIAGFKFIDATKKESLVGKKPLDMLVEVRKEVERDGEVTITYGAKSCMVLLNLYGFTLPSNTDPDGSSNDIRPVSFSLNDKTVNESQSPQKRSKVVSSAEEEALFQAQTERWYSGNKEEVRTVFFRLASSTAPKHYIFTPFTKALDACRVLTLQYSDISSQKSSGGASTHVLTEKRAVSHLITVLTNEISQYCLNNTSEQTDCLRLVRREVQTLSFYKEVAEVVRDILDVFHVTKGKDRVKKAKEILTSNNTRHMSSFPIEEEKLENPLLYPLAMPSSIISAYFQIKFGVLI